MIEEITTKRYRVVPYRNGYLIVNENQYAYAVDDLIHTSNMPVERVKAINKDYSTQKWYEWLITVKDNLNQYKPIEIVGKIVATSPEHANLGLPLIEISPETSTFFRTMFSVNEILSSFLEGAKHDLDDSIKRSQSYLRSIAAPTHVFLKGSMQEIDDVWTFVPYIDKYPNYVSVECKIYATR
jgi:hypothetical protein